MNDSEGPSARTSSRMIVVTVAVLLASSLSGCDDFMFGPLLNGDSNQPLSISPASAVVAVGATATFTAVGGITPYTFSVSQQGGSINESTGVYTAPDTDGQAEVTVTDRVGNTATADVTITIPASASINYQVDSVAWASGIHTGQAVTGSFVVSNIGADDGTHSIGWQVYASTNESVELSDDFLVDNGTLEALAAGTSSGDVAFSGYWPSDPGTYYLVVLLSTAPDDPFVSNNTGADSGTVITSPPALDLDYRPAAISNDGTPALSGSPINETFEIVNDGTETGASLVFWSAYVSDDTTLDGGDDLVDVGQTNPPAGSGGSTGMIAIDSGAWPTVAATTSYYLIVEVSATDEPAGNTSNNSFASAPFEINRPDVDYVVVTVSDPEAPVAIGSDIDEDLVIQNTGSNNGSATVYWEARISDGDSDYDGADVFASSGSLSPLAAGAASSAIPVTGTWPSAAGQYYLVVRISAAGDVDTTNNDGASAQVNVDAPGVDYVVTSVSETFSTVTTGSAVSENFLYKNSGESDGSAAVTYTVYAHTGATWTAGDAINTSAPVPEDLGAGSELAAGIESSAISIDAMWPVTADAYYLTVELTVADDTDPSNNTRTVGPFAVVDPPDYEVSIPAFPVENYGGHPSESIATASSDHGGSPTHQFQIAEIASNPGLQDISWTVYQSTDMALDGLDSPVASGSMPRLLADDSTLVTINFALPPSWGYWYYIVTAHAGDDDYTLNNTAVVGPVDVWSITGNSEFDTTEDDIAPVMADDFAIMLNPTDNVILDGRIDENGKRDKFLVRTGPATTEFQIRAWWSSTPTKNDLDLYLYDSSDVLVGSSTDTGTTDNMEPLGGGYWTVPGLTPNSIYYIDALSLATDDVGDTYNIEIIAAP